MGIETKSIRFSEEERYMLDHIEASGLRFSSYIKELIRKDIEVRSLPVDFDIKDMIKDALKNDNELKEIIRTIINEDEKPSEVSEEKEALGTFMKTRKNRKEREEE